MVLQPESASGQFLLTVLPVLCCIQTVYTYINIYFSFIKKHFMELNYSLIVGKMNLCGQRCVLVFFWSVGGEHLWMVTRAARLWIYDTRVQYNDISHSPKEKYQ